MQAAQHARPPREAAIPEELHPERRRRAARRAGSSGCGRTRPRRCTPPGRGRRSSPPAPRRASRWASTCRRSTCSAATRARARSTSTRPRRSRRTRRARSTRSASSRARPAIYDGDTPREQRAAIRRRANLVLTNPDMLHLGILPNHRGVGDLLREPRGRRRRRGARLPRRVRLPRRQRAAPPAPGRRRLRDRAALPAGQRDDRQPRRARRAADRPRRGHGRRARRRPARAAHDRDVEPAGHRRAARHAALARWPRRPTCSPTSSRGGARTIVLHEVAQGGRADGALRPARARGPRPAPSWPSGSRPTAPATPPQQRRELERRLVDGRAARRRARPTRSSSASTSARWTPRSA